MIKRALLYLSIVLCFGLALSCRQAKNVQEGSYLLKSNQISFVEIKKGKVKMESDHDLIDANELYSLVRPTPNRKAKLFFYNRIDTTRHKNQVERKEEKYRKHNEKKRAKEDAINAERIEKTEMRGDSLYKHKVVRKKDIKLGWREWMRSHLGQPPVLLDTFKVNKSREQIEIYLVKKGFYSGEVRDTIIYKQKKRKALVSFVIDAGDPYRIRDVKIDSISMNSTHLALYNKLQKKEDALLVKGNLLDQDVLDAERGRYSQYMRNEGAMFGFNKNYVGFVVDTTVGRSSDSLLADIIIYIKPRLVKDPKDTSDKAIVQIQHHVYHVKDVTFYLNNPDTSSFKNYQKYKERCAALGLGVVDSVSRKFHLLDTMVIIGKGTFIYNEIPFLDPNLLDRQNFLEIERLPDTLRYFKEYYIERSYRTMSNLGVFSNITPKVMVDPADPLGTNVVVSYDLMPLKKQSFMIKPSLANTNGILGIQGEIGYSNKNLRRGAQLLKISFTGGLESQPLIVGRDETGDVEQKFQLNTFEWGPKVSLTFPKLVPLPKKLTESISRRAYPKTILDLTINYQQRTEFRRNLFQAGYTWTFQQDKVQKWEIGILKIDYVKLLKEDFFQASLDSLNDPFLLNSYTNHLTTIFNPIYRYSNLNSNKRDHDNLHDIIASLDLSGVMLTPLIYRGLDAIGFNQIGVNSNDLKEFFGVPYTQFVKFDIQYVASRPINKKHKIVYRTLAGMGFAFGNSPSMPYEQSFFAGGSNDIRAFTARTMAPGSYKTYADPNATITQIGDTRFEANLEWRFEMTQLFEGTLFVDAGNIWNIRKDTISPLDPSVLKLSSWKEIAIGVGYGVRMDLDFLILRLDLSFALHNPHLPAGEKWFGSSKEEYLTYFTDPETGAVKDYEFPHALKFNFGIGYPF
jgi:hypothetical protein